MLFVLLLSDLCFIVECFYFTFDFYIPESREVPPSSDEAAEPKLAVSDVHFLSPRPCSQGEIARMAARPTTSDSAGLCNPVKCYS